MSQAASHGSRNTSADVAQNADWLRGMGRFALLTYVPTLALLAGLVALARFADTPIAVLTRDAAIVTEDVPFAGAISNLGAVIWSVAAVTSLFAAALLRQRGVTREWWLFLAAAGALSTLLLADDLFVFHDEIFPRIVGIPQKAVLLVYVVLTLAFAWRFRRQIRSTQFVPLIAGFAFFAGSLIADQALETRGLAFVLAGEPFDAENLLEDGLKLLGIVSWCGYLVMLSWQSLLNPPGQGQASSS